MSYAYQASVTIPAPSSGALTNFTAVIKGSDAILATIANGGQINNTVSRVGQTVPADLILSSDKAGASLYKWGVEYYDQVNGIVYIWVLLPSYSTSTTIYISVGNAAVTTYQGGAVGAEFDANTVAAWHLPNGASLSAADFSPAGNGGTVAGATATSGQIDGAANFLNTGSITQWITVADAATLRLAAGGTLAVWVKTSSASGSWMSKITPSDSFVGGWEYAVSQGNSAINPGKPSLFVHGSGWVSANTRVDDGAWHRITVTFNGTTTIFYRDGVADGSHAQVNPTTGTQTLYIGTRDATGIGTNPNYGCNGIADEIRVSSVARAASWIATEYANQGSIPLMGTFSPITSAFAPVSLPLVGAQ